MENVVKMTEKSASPKNVNINANGDSDLNNLKNLNNLNYASSKNNESMEFISRVKQVASYNEGNISKENENSQEYKNNFLNNNNNQSVNTHQLIKNPSMSSNITQISAVDNIKILNEFKNNIEDKISNLKKKLIMNSSLNSHFIKIDYGKFVALKNKTFFQVLQFFDTNDLFHLVNINKAIKNKLINIISDFSKLIITEFEKKYIRILKIDKKTIIFKKSKKNKRGHLKINLVLISKIFSDTLKNKSVGIGYKCKFPCDKEYLKNIYKFDVISPGPISFWVMREYTNVRNNI